MDLEFQECATCAAKPGSPSLCASCLHNRHAIGVLDRRLKRANDFLNVLRRLLDIEKGA